MQPAANLSPATGEQFIRLPAIIDLQTIEMLVETITPLLSEPELSLTLDASGVDIITSPGVQFILSVARTIEQTGGKLTIVRPSEFFALMFKALGMGPQLAQWGASK